MIYIIKESQKDFLIQNVLGDKVMVYYNLHKHTFSIKKGGIVITHADFVKLEDVEFRVRKGGRERVNMEKRKNVHAFVIGTLIGFCEHPCQDMPEEPSAPIATYNPYFHDSFVIKGQGTPIFTAKEVDLINGNNKIFIIQ